MKTPPTVPAPTATTVVINFAINNPAKRSIGIFHIFRSDKMDPLSKPEKSFSSLFACKISLVIPYPFPQTPGKINATIPTTNPAKPSLLHKGQGLFAEIVSIFCIDFRKKAPLAPEIIPKIRNHNILVKFVAWSKFIDSGRTYQGSIPNQKRETIVATTEDITSGAKRFIEKLPTRTKAAKRAPAIGALYAAANPAAAPQATINLSL